MILIHSKKPDQATPSAGSEPAEGAFKRCEAGAFGGVDPEAPKSENIHFALIDGPRIRNDKGVFIDVFESNDIF